MADLDDMEMVKCPHCGRECPKDFYPVCSCEEKIKTSKKKDRKKKIKT